MSYRCQECNKLHSGKELKVTKELRSVNYKHLIEKISRDPNEEPSYFLHNESNGQEALSTSKVCSACYETLKDNEPKIRENKIVKVIVSKKEARRIKDKRDDNSEGREERDRSRKFRKDTKSSVSYNRSGKFKAFEDLN